MVWALGGSFRWFSRGSARSAESTFVPRIKNDELVARTSILARILHDGMDRVCRHSRQIIATSSGMDVSILSSSYLL